ncbi:hypothetical protein EVAR_95153_1 [Eumeta japonica]|uniref:Mos1 transposase HTH domain-containing protein n=1 Tax=Eumeta variegata TaxID=151549 RepID=A0A4C1W608_EUMVA|nr:hypothetical protein EVAR_95153_1 [Eumeta japonica]
MNNGNAIPEAGKEVTIVSTEAETQTQTEFEPKQSLSRFLTVFGDEAPCKTTIYNWFTEFKRSRVNLSDEFRMVVCPPLRTTKTSMLDTV